MFLTCFYCVKNIKRIIPHSRFQDGTGGGSYLTIY
jgi:hypothetical protein